MSYKKVIRESTKYNKEVPKLKTKFLEYYSQLPIQKLAAEAIGKDQDTITNWKKKDKNFSDRIGIAKSEWALKNANQVKNSQWLLERILSEHFVEKKEQDDFETREEIDRVILRIRKILPASGE